MAQAAGYRTPRYLTFKQALDLGGHVRKGEHGTNVYFVKQLQVRDKDAADDDDATRTVPMLREYTVFNVDQCEKLPDRVTTPTPVKPRNPDQRDTTMDEFLACSGADIREGQARRTTGRVTTTSACRVSKRSRARPISTEWPFMNYATGRVTSRGLIAIYATASATGRMRLRNWSPSYARRFYAPSLLWMAIYGMPATSARGSVF
jgi:hypothetical protein